ncbi:MAG: anthranilate synthase component I [Chloroflexota bacterium]
MYTPTLAQARRLVGTARYAPVYREILADLETPVSAYLKLGGGRDSFLLESVEGGENVGRYSFIGRGPRDVLEIREDGATLETPDGNRPISYTDPLTLLDDLLGRNSIARLPGLPRFVGGAVGYFAWEIARCFERLPAPDADPLALPLARLMFIETLLVFDHSRRTIKAVTRMPLDGDLEANYRAATQRVDELLARLDTPIAPDRLASVPNNAEGIGLHDRVQSNFTPSDYIKQVLKAKEYIKAGDIYQVQIGQRFSLETTATPFAVYRAQRVLNPSPYMFFLDFGDYQLVGASPEILVLVEDGLVTTRPLAGTRWRGRTHEEDERIGQELLSNEKECAEHVMLVDLGRNDLGRVSEAGTVHVDQLMAIERYSHVMHIVSNVTGRLRKDLRPLDALRATFPAGTLSGAPKIRSMEIIAELEPDRRGPYGGAVGFLGWNGDVETAITIRTAVMKGGKAYVQAAAGIVADSDPAFEYEETVNKSAAMLRGVIAAERASRETPIGRPV